MAPGISLILALPITFAAQARPPHGSLAQTPAQTAGMRTLEFETAEVTDPDVAISPDGRWLVFNILGHLFRVPVTGGTAEQLTFGPYYDADPVFSPDGGRVAFVSDRDGSEGNIFVLDLATGTITQVTREPWAARPAWSPDGSAIAYLRVLRDVPGVVPLPWHSLPETLTALVRRVPAAGGEPETVSDGPRLIGSVFYLADGRLAWAAIDVEMNREIGSRATTSIEVIESPGGTSTLRTIAGYAAPAVRSPAADGVYVRRFRPILPWHTQRPEDLLFVPLPDGPERFVATLARPRGWAPRFAVTSDNRSLFLGEAGRLWKIEVASRVREPVPFRAQVKLEIRNPTPPPKAVTAASLNQLRPRVILDPRISPEGRTLVFGAAGYLWRQRVDGRPARRLSADSAFERDPAFSPDGRRLAFVRSRYVVPLWGANDEVRVLDLLTGETRTLASGYAYARPSWSPDGERLVFMRLEGPYEQVAPAIVVAHLTSGRVEKLAEPGDSETRPHFSADGRVLYYTGTPPLRPALYRLSLAPNAKPEQLTQLERPLGLGRALVSPDGRWLAFSRNMELWVARLDRHPVTERDARQVSPDGGDSFAFTPDGSALIYAAGPWVWLYPLEGGRRRGLRVRLDFERAPAAPLLLRRVRVLDFGAGGFAPEGSLLVDDGRIRWIGSENGRELPAGTQVIDAGARFAIPGLFDMHMHGVFGDQAGFIAYGVTSVRDVGGRIGALGALADRSEMTGEPVPRQFFSGNLFYGARPAWASLWPLQIDDEEEARRYVRLWKERGVDLLKVYFPLSWPLQRAVANEAHRQGLPVVGHGSAGVEQVVKSVTLGYASLEHSLTPSRAYDDVIQLLAAATTHWDPTLSTRGNALLLSHQPERLTDPKLRHFTPKWHILELQTGDLAAGIGVDEARGRWVELLASIRSAHQRGVRLLVGTDRFSGASLHWELEHFMEAGIPPIEVLRIATQEAARALGVEDLLGTLEPGKLADLVLLDANPLEDIRNTQRTWRVIKGGWVFDPEKLGAGRAAAPRDGR